MDTTFWGGALAGAMLTAIILYIVYDFRKPTEQLKSKNLRERDREYLIKAHPGQFVMHESETQSIKQLLYKHGSFMQSWLQEENPFEEWWMLPVMKKIKDFYIFFPNPIVPENVKAVFYDKAPETNQENSTETPTDTDQEGI